MHCLARDYFAARTDLKWAIALFMVCAVSAAGAWAQEAASDSDSPSIRGKKAFVTYFCYSCHGTAGHGSEDGPLLDTERLSLEDFSSYVREPAGSMPPFKLQSQIPDAALSDMYAYLKSLPPPPNPESIPLLNED